MYTRERVQQDEILKSLKRFRQHKHAFQEKLNEVLQEQGDVRHLVAIPTNPKLKKLDLSQDEKDSRIQEVSARAKEGHYFTGEILEDIADKMLSKLWNINLD